MTYHVKFGIMYGNVATKQTTLDDLVRQLNKLIGLSTAILERYARINEEFDSNRLANEEIRELLKELVIEHSRWADKLDKSIRELQRYVILVKMTGGNQETLQIESSFSKQQIESALKEELVNQQKLVIQYQKNINKVNERIAKFGETTPLVNELEEYQAKLGKAQESITRIREQLE